MTAPARTTGWPSAPKALVAAFEERFDCQAGTRFPPDLQQIAAGGRGVVRVIRLGGRRDRVTSYSRVAVDVVAGDEGRAEDLAEDIATWLADTRPIRAGGLLLDGAEVESEPHSLPYPDPAVAQFSATYVVTSRRMETR